ncbi:hypothetical protein BT96DRAFT_1002243 [Gymnopus androsaceus JB14]|uniref:Uncharacterized protein n=1 Tax=Gymnopus androsaceus JB14 TaxID=1447944 RepID=A0A6A4GZH0_9AGAR|nr:hypothetical protein BT96DRAFT_1002243 [Gymnopus androsaceus JB14]
MTASKVKSISTNSDLSEEIFEVLQPTFIMVIVSTKLYGSKKATALTTSRIQFVILLYGVYTLLFGLYTYLQIQQQGRIRYYQVSLLLLYLLATASIVIVILTKNQYDLYEYIAFFSADDFDGSVAIAHFTSFENLNVAAVSIYVAANIIADSLLVSVFSLENYAKLYDRYDFIQLYRCYIVWGSSRLVIAGPMFISVVNTVMALISAILEKKGSGRLLSAKGVTENSTYEAAATLEFAFLCVNLLTNLILTGLIAGRIWWISHTMNRLLNSGSNDKRINGISAIVLESGLLYPVTLIICIILAHVDSVQSQPLLTMVVGIAPTLIMVRVDLGISIENASNGVGTTTTDHPSDLEMNKYGRFEDTPEPEGYGWKSASKGKASQTRAFAASELGEEIEPLSARYLDASPPTFNESQQGSSRLISAGPSSGPGEKSGLVILSPPEEL